MLDRINSRISEILPRSVLSSLSSIEEGAPLIFVQEDGEHKVKASAGGADTDVFAGVAFSEMDLFDVGVEVEEVTVPSSSPYKVVLKHAPTAYTAIGALVLTGTGPNYSYTALTPDTGTSPSDGGVELEASTANLYFHSDEAGALVRVTYRYNLTVAEKRALVGDGVIGAGHPVGSSGAIGAITRGDVYISNFDPSKNWTANGIVVKAGANGLFTIGGTGSTVPCSVISSPNVDRPFLGLHIHV